MTDILTVAEVAAMLRISKRQVCELVNGGTPSGQVRQNPLPGFKIGKLWRFRRSDVEAWVENLTMRQEMSVRYGEQQR